MEGLYRFGLEKWNIQSLPSCLGSFPTGLKALSDSQFIELGVYRMSSFADVKAEELGFCSKHVPHPN